MRKDFRAPRFPEGSDMDETMDDAPRGGEWLRRELWLYEDHLAALTALAALALTVAAPVALGLATCPAAGWALLAALSLAWLLLGSSLWLAAAGGDR